MCQMAMTTQKTSIPRVNTSEGGVFFDCNSSSSVDLKDSILSIGHNNNDNDGNYYDDDDEFDDTITGKTVFFDRNESVASTAETAATTTTDGSVDNSDINTMQRGFSNITFASSTAPLSRAGSSESFGLPQLERGGGVGGGSIGLELSWKSTGTPEFLLNAPLLVTDPDDVNANEPIPNPAQKLGQIISRSSHLPSMNNQYASNHIMVNQERIRRCTAPLIRLCELDAIAREHAETMAREDRGLFHIEPGTLLTQFHRTYRRMGENVAKGTSIRDIHTAMMADVSDRNNIIDRRYTHFGMATARSKSDDEFYLCQVFRG